MAAAKPEPKQVEIEEVTMVGDGKGRFRVAVQRIRGVVVSERVLEESVTMPVARQAAVVWRSKNGGLHRGLK
jgi:hypothetical protein